MSQPVKFDSEIDFNEIISVERVFKARLPRAYRFIPRLLVDFLKRKTREEDVRRLLAHNGAKRGIDWINGMLEGFGVSVSAANEELAARPGRHIYVGNHPHGGIDGLCVFQIIARHHPRFFSLSNDTLWIIPNVRDFIVPVNQTRRQNKDFVRRMHEVFESDAQILTYPSGVVSYKTRDGILDGEWSQSFIRKAVQYRRDVIPFHMSGQVSDEYYRAYRLSRLVGLNSIVMLFIMDEFFKLSGTTIQVTFGEPIPYQTFDSRYDARVWATKVRDHVYSIPHGRKAFPYVSGVSAV